MGYRLKGPVIAHARGHDIVSDGIPLGGIQVPGEGQPIVLLVDRQTTGGYTKIATVIGVDIAAIGQTRPGQRVRFRRVTLEEAHAALAEETGVTIVLVEQNARAALQVADHGYVLEMGELSAQGPAMELASDPRVIETYLGTARKRP